MGRIGFGTDGVRGVANVELTAELATAIGRAAAHVLQPAQVVVGRDTRRSGPMLQAALSAGFAAQGVDVVDLGVLPTAGVAYCAARRGVPAAMVSASHNPYTDNGIKLFDGAGVKLAPEVEALVEAALDATDATDDTDAATAADRTGAATVGWVSADPGAADAYCRHLVDALGGRRLDGMSVVVDCANGAAAGIAPAVLRSLGASVTAIADRPDGTNINADCGSTRPERLAAAVPAAGADLGLAFDGDADRLVAVDHTGTLLDGDALLAIFAVDLAARGELDGGAVAVTVMTNLGFRHAMAARGIGVVETPVGDRQVLAAIDGAGLCLGGEQSGHIVFRRLATTGDGLLTGILLADVVQRSATSLAALADGLVERVPQVLVNVAVPDPVARAAAPAVRAAVAEAEAALGDSGRVLLRPSGTEPLVRVMVEAPTDEAATTTAARLATAVEEAPGDR